MEPRRARRIVQRLSLWLFLIACSWAGRANAATKREPQNYHGAKDPTAQAGWLWVPRVLLFPPWLISEYVIRQPIGALVRTAEKNEWPEKFVNFFTFGERQNVTLYPSALFDFGLKPSVGFNLGWKYFLAEENTLNVHAGTWGPDWIALRATDEYQFSAKQKFVFDAMLVNRKDIPFYGMGPSSPSSPRYRYQSLTSELAVGYNRAFWRSSELVSRAGMRTLSFGDGTCCGNRGLTDAVSSGDVPAPPGFGDGYIGGFQSLSVAVDSRRPLPDNGTGFRLEAHGEGLFAPPRAGEERRAWVSYGAGAGVAIDTWNGRVVGIGVRADLSDPLLGTIPFTDQVTLGGDRPMRGYLRGRLVDRSALVATVQYTWPVWVYLDGVLKTDVGNVFGSHFDGFAPNLLRMSSGIGLRSNGSPTSGFEFLIAAGTDPFTEGFHVSSFRLVIGSHHGF